MPINVWNELKYMHFIWMDKRQIKWNVVRKTLQQNIYSLFWNGCNEHKQTNQPTSTTKTFIFCAICVFRHAFLLLTISQTLCPFFHLALLLLLLLPHRVLLFLFRFGFALTRSLVLSLPIPRNVNKFLEMCTSHRYENTHTSHRRMLTHARFSSLYSLTEPTRYVPSYIESSDDVIVLSLLYLVSML